MMQGVGSLTAARASPQPSGRVPSKVRQGAAVAGQSEAGGKEGAESRPEARAEQPAADPRSVVNELNQALKQINSRFSASVDDATGMVVVRITDRNTGELVKQVPPQQVLDASVSMEKIIGLLVNDEA